MQSQGHYLALRKKPITFEPVSAVNNVFFDEVNKQVGNSFLVDKFLVLYENRKIQVG